LSEAQVWKKARKTGFVPAKPPDMMPAVMKPEVMHYMLMSAYDPLLSLPSKVYGMK